MPQFRGGGAEGQKRKICLFLSQLMENQKLYNISENQSPKAIRRGDMGIPPFLISKKCCSALSSLHIGLEAEIRYVHLVAVLNGCFQGLNFSAPFHPLTPSKK